MDQSFDMGCIDPDSLAVRNAIRSQGEPDGCRVEQYEYDAGNQKRLKKMGELLELM
jgi:hypothetical protein